MSETATKPTSTAAFVTSPGGREISERGSLSKARRLQRNLIRAWVYDHSIVDRVIAFLLAPLVAVLLLTLWPIALIAQGRPFLYGATRMKSPTCEFRLWKIRTMRTDDGAALTVLGGDQVARVTKLGQLLRRTRLDEIPQVFNILSGDVRFVGPRPPLRKYVEAYPKIYAQVLASKPGITGLATVLLHKRERRLLATCRSSDETDEVYRRACIPIKARLDTLYLQRRSLCLDAFVIYRTFAGLLPEKAARKRKVTTSRTVARQSALPDEVSQMHSGGGGIESRAA